MGRASYRAFLGHHPHCSSLFKGIPLKSAGLNMVRGTRGEERETSGLPSRLHTLTPNAKRYFKLGLGARVVAARRDMGLGFLFTAASSGSRSCRGQATNPTIAAQQKDRTTKEKSFTRSGCWGNTGTRGIRGWGLGKLKAARKDSHTPKVRARDWMLSRFSISPGVQPS